MPDPNTAPPDAPQDATESPQDAPRMFDGAAVAKIVQERLARASASHEKALAAVAEQAARSAAQRAREAADAEWGQLLADAGVDLDELRRDQRFRRAMRSAPLRRRIPQAR